MKPSLSEKLLKSAAFLHPVTELKLFETHISWVVLTGLYAYKIKKPVNFEFLDYSTLEKRLYYCQRELQLNRRFAPEIYIDVVAISDVDGQWKFDNSENIADYAVKMRQFDNDYLADKLADRHQLTSSMVRKLASEIAHFHHYFPSYQSEKKETTAKAFEKALCQNFQQIETYPIADVDRKLLIRIKDWQLRAVEKFFPLMARRAMEGYVKDCHGDCHLGNIVFINDKPTLFDCIEFNDDFRLMDTIAEAGFLSMDLCARNFSALADRFLNDYLEYRGDYDGLKLLELFRSHFAVVRAKVSLLKEDPNRTTLQSGESYLKFNSYLQLAETFTHNKPSFLAIMHGVSGTGKSYLAGNVCALTGAIRIRSDVERKRLFNMNPEQSSSTIADMYSANASRLTFSKLLELAITIIDAGFPCIVDATFLEQSTRQPFIEWARDHAIPFAILSCHTDEKVIRQRLLERTQRADDASEADVRIYERQLYHAAPISNSELVFTHIIDTDAADCVDKTVRILSNLARCT